MKFNTHVYQEMYFGGSSGGGFSSSVSTTRGSGSSGSKAEANVLKSKLAAVTDENIILIKENSKLKMEIRKLTGNIKEKVYI